MSEGQFTSRETPGDSRDEIYLIHDGKQNGPFSISEVTYLRDSGQLPPETLYWREGMGGAAPFFELTDEIVASRPRPHHYAFAYRWLPMLVFGSPVSNAVRHQSKLQLWDSWTLAGKQYSPDDLTASNGLTCEMVRLETDAELLLITMPAPRRSQEAYFVGILSSIPDDLEKIRFFVLAHSDANEKYGGHNALEGCVRELCADGGNYRSKAFADTTIESFVADVRELLKSEPQGIFRTQGPRFA